MLPVHPPTLTDSLRWLANAVAACSIGCLAAPPATGELSHELTCGDFGCHDNSPEIAGAAFYELQRAGERNERGLSVVGFRSARGDPYQIDVQGARLVGLDSLGNIALDTPDMSGAVIELVDLFGNAYGLTVVEIGSIDFWAAPQGSVTTYEFRVVGPGADADLCSSPPDAIDWPGIVTHAILFEGDRYLPAEKEVLAVGAATDGWFNIACAGTATAKMLLTRHTEVGQPPGVSLDLFERQAMLRAFTAAVCPGSDAFTAKGEGLEVADRKGVMHGAIDLARVEALWGPDGAVCLGEQRLVHSDSMPQQEADRILAEIPVQCPSVPPCSSIRDFPLGWEQHGMVLSTNP